MDLQLGHVQPKVVFFQLVYVLSAEGGLLVVIFGLQHAHESSRGNYLALVVLSDVVVVLPFVEAHGPEQQRLLTLKHHLLKLRVHLKFVEEGSFKAFEFVIKQFLDVGEFDQDVHRGRHVVVSVDPVLDQAVVVRVVGRLGNQSACAVLSVERRIVLGLEFPEHEGTGYSHSHDTEVVLDDGAHLLFSELELVVVLVPDFGEHLPLHKSHRNAVQVRLREQL